MVHQRPEVRVSRSVGLNAAKDRIYVVVQREDQALVWWLRTHLYEHGPGQLNDLVRELEADGLTVTWSPAPPRHLNMLALTKRWPTQMFTFEQKEAASLFEWRRATWETMPRAWRGLLSKAGLLMRRLYDA